MRKFERQEMNMYRLFAGCLIAVSFAAPGDASAECWFINGKSELIANLPLKDEYYVAPGTPVGTVLDDVSISPDTVAYARCRLPESPIRNVYGGVPVGNTGAFTTGVPGIGLIFYETDPPDSFGHRFVHYWGDGIGPWRPGDWGWWGWVSSTPRLGSRLGVMLVVTGPVGVGSVAGGSVYARMTISGLPVGTLRTGGFRITTPACSVPNVSVVMGEVSASRFRGVGTTAGDTPFDLRLNACPAGRTAIYYRLDPTTSVVPGTGESVAALTGSRPATGIGLQLLDALGKPLVYGSTMQVAGYAGSAGDYSVPLRARYYQTDASVTAGNANAAVTVTISYD
ncbi:fimbrial protein [Burkholderia vietnamiensis]|uniref:fimbrial protein n=2 Tax=Burkholderia vietnamiensis TaxID=60552 RepID=UPI0031FDF5A0